MGAISNSKWPIYIGHFEFEMAAIHAREKWRQLDSGREVFEVD